MTQERAHHAAQAAFHRAAERDSDAITRHEAAAHQQEQLAHNWGSMRCASGTMPRMATPWTTQPTRATPRVPTAIGQQLAPRLGSATSPATAAGRNGSRRPVDNYRSGENREHPAAPTWPSTTVLPASTVPNATVLSHPELSMCGRRETSPLPFVSGG